MQSQEAEPPVQAGPVRFERRGDVAVLVLAHPPVNALSAAVSQGLSDALARAVADRTIRAVVLRGEGQGFSAGADGAEFGKVSSTQKLSALCQAIEDCPKPVIAALHGTALGAGLELALAAHYRIANAAAFLGLPEVNLGLLPGAGGTQRLPRLIGGAEALRMILTGVPVRAVDALAMGLVDRVVEQDLERAALAMAREAAGPRRTADQRQGLRDMAGYMAALRAARSADEGNHLPAPARIMDCIEAAALLPMAQGLALEATAFADLAQTPEAAALRHAFFCERRAAQPPTEVAPKAVGTIAVLGIWGLDDMAVDLAFQALTAGMRVVLAGQDRPLLVDALERIAARQDQAVGRGLITEAVRDADWARLTTSLAPEPLAKAELVLRTGDAPALPSGLNAVPLATMGTATLGGPELAVTVPAAAGGMAELSMTQAVAPEAVARCFALARRLNWRVVFTGPGGPIELGLRQALAGATQQLQAEGKSRDLIGAALAAFGMVPGARSPLPQMPMGGQTIVNTCLAALGAEGARMLQDGRAHRPLVIDAVALLSGLMPRWQGGPMFQADQRGLLLFRKALLDRAARSEIFEPAPILDQLIADGRSFDSLNRR